ncbi:MAG: Na+/H+ antiporter subunit E [Chroococcidiopsidaceae cyanobacterium CP_BM_RX_35]|nr:Na+/H+ antiporter subunit E [Chroococcidiopsidaceae cyanobacterium CP_BM_RX_35]
MTRKKRLLSWFAEWVVLSLFWFIFVGKFALMEVLVGILATALVVAATEIVRKQNFARFRPHKRWLLGAWQLPISVLRDCAIVMAVMWRRVFQAQNVRGSFQVLSFPSEGSNSRSSARRALAVTLISLPPNTYVVDIDREKNLMLLHELEPQAQPSKLAKLLGAKEAEAS